MRVTRGFYYKKGFKIWVALFTAVSLALQADGLPFFFSWFLFHRHTVILVNTLLQTQVIAFLRLVNGKGVNLGYPLQHFLQRYGEVDGAVQG